MKSDTLIKTEGMRVLSERLGMVEAERFITLVLRQSFDYTEWQRDLYGDLSVKDLFARIKAFERRRLGASAKRHRAKAGVRE